MSRVNTLQGPFHRMGGNATHTGYEEFQKGILRSGYCSLYEDFLPDAGATLPVPWGKQDTSSAGSPTLDYVADARNGVYNLAHDGQSEQQNLTLYWADQVCIPMTRGPIFECRLAINFAGATFSADQRLVFGLASARNATLNSIVSNAWFRVEGANLNLLVESDDGTTDTDDQDTTLDVVDNTYHKFLIDCSGVSQVRFYADLDGNGWQSAGSTAAAAWAVTDVVQPYIELQRDAGTEAESVLIDYIAVHWTR